MNRTIHFLKHNAIALAALFVALGGTSYAAIAIPRNSIGSRQLRTGAVTSRTIHAGAITPNKLSGRSFGGRILYFALIGSDGTVALSSPRGIRTEDWSLYSGGIVVFPHRIPEGCAPMAGGASSVSVPASTPATAPAVGMSLEGNRIQAQLGTNGATPVTIEIICDR